MTSRRDFLKFSGAGLAVLATGCDPRLIRPPNCDPLPPGVPTAIDAHCHVFNGTDLQVGDFISKIQLGVDGRHPFAKIARWVQEYTWRHAPTADQELDWLRSAKSSTLRPPFAAGPVTYAQALGAMVEGMGQNTDMVFDDFFGWLYEEHPEDAAAFASEIAFAGEAAEPKGIRVLSAGQVLDIFRSSTPGQNLVAHELSVGARSLTTFVKTFFRYRTENIWTMQTVYGCDSAPSIEMLCPAMVDFDLWIGDREQDQGRTRSSVESQLLLMSEISLASEGRVHALAPFNPLRAACDPAYLALCKRAVTKMGLLGFKLYPPMGFKAIGNSPTPVPGTSRSCPGSGVVSGARLDEVLLDFYEFCAANDVPVMAHTSSSNGPSSAAEKCAAPAHWAQLIRTHPEFFKGGGKGLRISLGHMGGDVSVDEESIWRSEIVQLIRANPGVFFADLGYYEHIISRPAQRRKLALQLAFLKSEPSVSGGVMYGSDWSMLAKESKANVYLSSFLSFLREEIDLVDPARINGLLADNAKRFFAIAPGMQGHARLQEFHAGDPRKSIPFLQL